MRSRAVIVAAALSGALVTGGWLMQEGLGRSLAGPLNGARLFDEVFAHIERQYVDTVSDSALYHKAVDGMLQELHDPHTVFLTPARLAKLTESTSGRYGGVGIQIDIRGGWITVVTPLPGTPAQAAGIRTGDRLVQIEGKQTEGWTAEEAQNALRGAPGSVVHVVAERPGVEARLPFTLVRREIHFDPVQHAMLLRDGVGYVALTVFGEGSDSELRHAIDSLRAAGSIKSLIFDLRGNPGGLLEQGVGVADLFLDPGQPIVSMRGRTADANRQYLDRAPQAWPNLHLVALVDSGSASASEIVAGALQDHDRAVLVGTTTYGKGSAQSLFPMANGGALKLTTALWFTPSGRSINKMHANDDSDDSDGSDLLQDTTSSRPRPKYRTDSGRVVFGGGGITPDVVVKASAPDTAEQALERALGKQIPAFRGALTDYALALKSRGTVRTPDFVVTPEMRSELYARLQQRGVSVPRTTYDSAATLVDRLLGYQIAQYVFGPEVAFARQTRDDPFIAAAMKVLANGGRVPAGDRGTTHDR